MFSGLSRLPAVSNVLNGRFVCLNMMRCKGNADALRARVQLDKRLERGYS